VQVWPSFGTSPPDYSTDDADDKVASGEKHQQGAGVGSTSMKGMLSVAFSCEGEAAPRLISGVMRAVVELRQGMEPKEEGGGAEGGKEGGGGSRKMQSMAELLQAEVQTEQNNHEEDVMTNR
jgi:hypothetical protein